MPRRFEEAVAEGAGTNNPSAGDGAVKLDVQSRIVSEIMLRSRHPMSIGGVADAAVSTQTGAAQRQQCPGLPLANAGPSGRWSIT